MLYLDGEGVQTDPTIACAWFEKAARQGHAAAQYSLGACYLRGRGVRRNYVLACAWLSLAADTGDSKINEVLERVVARLSQEDLDEAARLAREWRSVYNPGSEHA